MTPTTLRELLIRNEGTRLRPYVDCCGKSWKVCACAVKGNLTIGTGRNLDAKGVSLGEADLMLDNDAREANAAVIAEFPWSRGLDDVRRNVLIDMVFNLGLAGVLGFTKALAAAASGDWFTAAAHLMDSKWARQVGIRAERDAEMWRSGEWS